MTQQDEKMCTHIATDYALKKLLVSYETIKFTCSFLVNNKKQPIDQGLTVLPIDHGLCWVLITCLVRNKEARKCTV